MADTVHYPGTTSESYLKWSKFEPEIMLTRLPNDPSTWKCVALATGILLFFWRGRGHLYSPGYCNDTIHKYNNNNYNVNKLHNKVLHGFRPRQILRG